MTNVSVYLLIFNIKAAEKVNLKIDRNSTVYLKIKHQILKRLPMRSYHDFQHNSIKHNDIIQHDGIRRYGIQHKQHTPQRHSA